MESLGLRLCQCHVITIEVYAVGIPSLLAITAITIVTSALYLPEARLPVVIWLLSVALMWRPSPGRDG